MANPVVDVIAGVTPGRRTLRILPVYPASAKVGLTSWEIGAFVEEALERAGEFADPVPGEWRTSLDLWGRTESFDAIHRPESLAVIEPARRRLVFDELFRLQLALVLRRRAFEVNARALRHDVSPREVTGGVADTLVARFLAGLPYELTTAQRRALAVIVADMAGPFPMHRLLQGDVGLGQDRRGAGRAPRRRAERAPGRADGADRGAGRTALHRRRARCSATSRAPAAWRAAWSASSSSPARSRARRAPRSSRASPRARSASSSAPMPC